jgi:hypothetical protein
MAFRSGVTGNVKKGTVYSRRKGRGAALRGRVFQDRPSVIYEESDEEGSDGHDRIGQEGNKEKLTVPVDTGILARMC